MEEKLIIFSAVRKEVEEVIKAFPEESRNQILFGKWSLVELVAHLSNWMVHDIDCLEKLKQRRDPVWEPDFDEFNEKGVKARRGWSWEKVIKEFGDLGVELAGLYKTLPDDLWDVPIWKGFGLTARKFLQKDIEHQEEHLNDLKDKLHKYLFSDTETHTI